MFELGAYFMDKAMIVVNFKTYETASGESAESLAMAMEQFTDRDFRMVAVVSAFDLSAIASQSSNLEVWSQHLDPVGKGSHTGWLEPELAINRGAVGTIINHAEHKVDIQIVAKLMEMLPDDFPICACAADVDEAIALAKLNPTFIAVEPPELIGGDISVTTADPSIVSDTVAAVKSVNPNVRVLCGAGVKNGADVKKAIELGAEGVLLASGVTKASDVMSVLDDLTAS
tara:strand:- start:111 stop:797 length:687 start_codon:yes stop_codon:yes gene_type:complete